MNDAAKGQEFVGRLYQLIAEYEADPLSLDADAFGDLYQRVIRAIDLSGESTSAAFALDSALFNAVSLDDVDRSDLREVHISVEEAFKVIMSAGIVTPKSLPQPGPAPLASAPEATGIA